MTKKIVALRIERNRFWKEFRDTVYFYGEFATKYLRSSGPIAAGISARLNTIQQEMEELEGPNKTRRFYTEVDIYIG